MSREIKLRAWSIKKRKYIDIDDLYCANGKVCGVVCDGVVYDIDNVVLEQYTGSKDQYGKEICEGDIIKIAEKIAGYVIQDANGQWVIFCDDKEPVKVDVTLGELSEIPKLDLGNTLAREYCSIVGNIHENPELLEDKK